MKIIKLFLICTLAISITGCLKIKNTLTIKKSGNGNIEIKYAISERAINQLNSMRKLQEQMQRFSGKEIQQNEEARYAYMFLMPREKELRKELESYEHLGVKIKELKVETRNAWRHVDMNITFTDLEKLSQIPVFKYVGFSLIKNKTGDYVFYQASEPSKNSPMPDVSNEKVLRKLSPILSGFKVIFTLKTPGIVLKTNADRKSNYSSMWIFDFDKDPKSILKLQKSKFITIFSSTGLDLPEIRVNNTN
jgi:uncharacterized lipoprotein YehR (DUF1307 family)